MTSSVGQLQWNIVVKWTMEHFKFDKTVNYIENINSFNYFSHFENVQSFKKFNHPNSRKLNLLLISPEVWGIFVIRLLINWLINVP